MLPVYHYLISFILCVCADEFLPALSDGAPGIVVSVPVSLHPPIPLTHGGGASPSSVNSLSMLFSSSMSGFGTPGVEGTLYSHLSLLGQVRLG